MNFLKLNKHIYLPLNFLWNYQIHQNLISEKDCLVLHLVGWLYFFPHIFKSRGPLCSGSKRTRTKLQRPKMHFEFFLSNPLKKVQIDWENQTAFFLFPENRSNWAISKTISLNWIETFKVCIFSEFFALQFISEGLGNEFFSGKNYTSCCWKIKLSSTNIRKKNGRRKKCWKLQH